MRNFNFCRKLILNRREITNFLILFMSVRHVKKLVKKEKERKRFYCIIKILYDNVS